MKRVVFEYGQPLEAIDKTPHPVHVFRTPSAMDDFLTEEVSTGVETTDGKTEKVIFVTSDISILFNQQRLSRLSPLALNEMVERLKSSPKAPDVPDDILMQAVKSRYIQSQADVYAYTRMLETNLDAEVQKVREYVESRQKSEESTPAPTPAGAGE